MHNIFDAKWYWRRVEAQGRASLHQHGTFRAGNDHNILKKCSAALRGFLAQKKLNYLQSMSAGPENVFSKYSSFSNSQHSVAQQESNTLLPLLQDVLSRDALDHAMHSYYIGVRAQSESGARVRDGTAELSSADAHGLIDTKIIHALPDLDACTAFTLESRMIEHAKKVLGRRLENKSSVFGLGCKHVSSKYTLSIIRGKPRTTQFDAYDLPNSVEELQEIISAGNDASSYVCAFHDAVISSWNPSDPSDWQKPVSNPACFNHEDIPSSYREQDRIDLLNSVNRHTRCGPHCKRRHNKSGKMMCRFHFPKEELDATQLEFEPVSKTKGGSVLYRVKVRSRRNDPLLNNYNPDFIDYWRANLDFQLVVDETSLMDYIAKYAGKAERTTDQCMDILQKLSDFESENVSMQSILRKGMLRMAGVRDYGAPEILYTSLGLPLIDTNLDFIPIDLEGTMRLNLRAKSSEKAACETLHSRYASRATLSDSSLLRLNITRDAMVNLNFCDFVKRFVLVHDDLRVRTPKLRKIVVFRFYPNPRGRANNPDFWRHCKYQLLKYFPWHDSPNTMLAPFVSETCDLSDPPTTAWVDCYQAFLRTPLARDSIPRFEFEQHQAFFDSSLRVDDDLDQNDEPSPATQAEHMAIMDMMMRATGSSSVPSWTHSDHDWPSEFKDSLHTWLQESKKDDPSGFSQAAVDGCLDIAKVGSPEQRLVFNIVANHSNESALGNNPKPLRLLIQGTAGTGKTATILALRKLLGNKLHASATTGSAGVIISAGTIHTLVKLPNNYRQRKDLNGKTLQRLQDAWEGPEQIPRTYLIVDEISMMGRTNFYWLDRRLRQITGKNESFGGISVILSGDFGQLAPVKDSCLFDTPLASDDQHRIFASILFSEFRDVVILKQNFRCQDPEFVELLLRLRVGFLTKSDIALLKSRMLLPSRVSQEELAAFDNATRLRYRTTDVAAYNCGKLAELGNPSARIDAINSNKTAASLGKYSIRAPNSLFLSSDALVMLTKNLWQTKGLVNGAIGIVYDIVYQDGCSPPDLPLAVLVQFPSYTGPSCSDRVDHLVPITPFDFHAFGYKDTFRTQLPLHLAWARTIHKSQGMTIDKSIINLSLCASVVGLAYVALSRSRTRHDFFIEHIDGEIFNKLACMHKLPSMQSRVREDKRLATLASQTEVRYSHLT